MTQMPLFPQHPVRAVWLTFLSLSAWVAIWLPFLDHVPPLAFGYCLLLSACVVGIFRLELRALLILTGLASVFVAIGSAGVALILRSGLSLDTGYILVHVSLYLFYALGLAALFFLRKVGVVRQTGGKMGNFKHHDALLDRIANGRTDLVFDFVAAGESATFRDAGGASLISTCAYFGDVSAIRFLLSQGEQLESLGRNLGLNSAAFHGHWQLCEFLLENGADANGADPNTGETSLHAALCTARRPGCGLAVKVLIAAGADPNRTTKPGVETGGFMRDCRTKGETALHRAAAFASEETIQLLLDAGATVDAKDVNGDTPLSWASWYTRDDSVLRKLCYGQFHIREGRKSMEIYLLGEPRKS